MPSLPRVAIIGAGSSGIAGLKTLAEAGLDVVAYEKGDRVGGNWVYRNSNGMSASYRSLHINTSRTRMAYSDFPMPGDYPDFPHHSQIARYFDDYVDHFEVRDRIRFRTGVASARRRDGGGWELTTDTGETESYDALVVANGHHWNPRWPEPAFPGAEGFTGTQSHSHAYDTPDPYRGSTVVVLGMGNSAMDVAAEVGLVADHVYLAMRRGEYVVPKYVHGRPLDLQTPAAVTRMIARLPWRVRQRLAWRVFRPYVDHNSAYGLPRPDHPFGAAHPTISDAILTRITHGLVTPKPNIARFEGDTVHFTDGSSVRADHVVYATGYKVTFPFFDEGLVSAPGNDLPLYRRVFHPDVEGVYFLSLLQPLGATMPLAEAQGRWIGEHLRGRYLLPPHSEMLADMAAERAELTARYVRSPRHTMQVDFDTYLWRLEQELTRGRRRAAEAGFPLPVPGRAPRPAAR